MPECSLHLILCTSRSPRLQPNKPTTRNPQTTPENSNRSNENAATHRTPRRSQEELFDAGGPELVVQPRRHHRTLLECTHTTASSARRRIRHRQWCRNKDRHHKQLSNRGSTGTASDSALGQPAASKAASNGEGCSTGTAPQRIPAARRAWRRRTTPRTGSRSQRPLHNQPNTPNTDRK